MNTLIMLMATLALGAPLGEEEILGKADARIEKHRTGDAVLKLVGPDGQPIAPGSAAKIEQTNHAFLFGCNIFTLGRCKTAEDNAAYEKRFAELLNYATLPFYWWAYEAEQGKPDDARTRVRERIGATREAVYNDSTCPRRRSRGTLSGKCRSETPRSVICGD